MNTERAFWLAWSRVEGVGATLLLRLQKHFGTLAEAWTASASTLEAVEGFGRQTAEIAAAGRSRINPYELLAQHEQENSHFWTPADPLYPRLLLEITDPPPVLYYRGIVEPQENEGYLPMIAIVGTRSPSDYGRRWTRRISAALAQAGYTVVSGLAEGVDTEAHQTCISAGGRTIAVLGTGVDMVYPWSNRNLSKQVEQHGLLVSEYPAGTQPDRPHFPRRNRIIAGLCRATLVLEAPRKSGALITARLANEYGRDVYALPASLDNDRGKGCLDVINNGAHMILGERELLNLLEEMPHFLPPRSPSNQLSLFNVEPQPEPVSPPVPPLEPELQQVLATLTTDAIALDAIVQQSELATGNVLAALAQLELLGLVTQVPGMRYRKG